MALRTSVSEWRPCGKNRSPLPPLFEQPRLPLLQLSSPWPATSELSFSSSSSRVSCLLLPTQGQKRTPVTREKQSHIGASSSTRSLEEVMEAATEVVTEEVSEAVMEVDMEEDTGLEAVRASGVPNLEVAAPPVASPSPTATASPLPSAPFPAVGLSLVPMQALTNSPLWWSWI